MKTIIIALSMLFSSAVVAQNISFGPSAGFSHSWMTGTDNVVFKPGFNVGATLVYSFNPKWGLGGDVRASFLEGVKTESSENHHSMLNATYLRVPLKVFHFFGKYGDRVRPKIFAGPSLGFLLGGKNKPYGLPHSDVKNVLQTFDFGFVAGAGFNYRILPATWLNVDLAYTNGLLDATKGTGSVNPFSSNRNLALNVGVAFPLGTIR